MASRSVKKLAVATTDIGGLKSSRYEKLQVSYGSIEASSYDLLDTIVFSDVPAQSLVRATFVAHDVSPVTLEVYPGTADLSLPLTVGSLSSPVKISYVIEYSRGGGRVGDSSADDSGEGQLLTIVVGDIATLTTTQMSNLTTKQISKLTKAQIKAMTTAEAASMTTAQVVALTTSQYPVFETQDFAAFTTTQLSAMEPEDVAVLTSSELKELSTTQLHAFTTEQTSVLSTTQTAGLTTSQLAALQ